MARRFIPRCFFLSLILALAALAVGACQPARPVCGSQIASGGDFENVCGFSVEGGAKEANLYMQVKLRSGRMQWTLEDPVGAVVWRGFADASAPVEKSARIENPMPGMWSLRVETYKAVGEYSAPWMVE